MRRITSLYPPYALVPKPQFGNQFKSVHPKIQTVMLPTLRVERSKSMDPVIVQAKRFPYVSGRMHQFLPLPFLFKKSSSKKISCCCFSSFSAFKSF